jgi:chromosome segregation ATPase
MRRFWLFVFSVCFLSFCASTLGQSPSSEQGMQALVAEVRQLRKDLQASNGNALKAQILLQRLQFQEAAVARASERLNDARGRLAATQRHRAEVADTSRRFAELLENTETSSEDRQRFQGEISAKKQELEALAAVEQQQQAAEMEAEEQLRTEQTKLNELEERVDRLEKNLDNPHQ